MDISYLHTLQRAWDRYNLHDIEDGAPAPVTRTRYTIDDKIKHLTGFMQANNKDSTSMLEYENSADINRGMISCFTRWLMDGRLGVTEGELYEFFFSRWASNKKVKKILS